MTKKQDLNSSFFLLDAFSAENLDKWEAQKEKIIRYHWDLYSALAYERSKAADQLRASLLEAAAPCQLPRPKGRGL